MRPQAPDPDPRPAGHEPSVASGPWRRRSRRIAYSNPWIDVLHDEVDRPDGSPGIYGVVHFHNRAVGVVAVDDDGRLLLVGQHRYSLDEYSWEIPEGGAGAEESLTGGARRELREETGFDASWREIGRFHLSNSVTDEAGVLYLATDLAQQAAAPETTEDLAVRWVPFDDALTMTLDGRITDAMAIMGIQRVAIDRLRGAGT
jgi:8-oxo-dGTP pyrophosphatase MutT (NUDIX family)